MKLTVVFLTLVMVQAGAHTIAQQISFSGNNVPLEKVFRAIKKQTGFSFFFNDNDLQKAKPVTVQWNQVPLQQALDALLQNQPLGYVIDGKTIFISLKPAPAVPAVPPSPPVDVKGRITNESGEPVAASVLVKGTQQGASTNADGYFELKAVDENATLVISGVSIETMEVKVNGRTSINITVQISIAEEDEVVVKTNYWEVKKRENTGNISKVTYKTIEKQPISNPLQAIQGRMPGVYIQQQTGVPGAGFTIRIRGQNSIRNGNEPFYVIDGVPYTGTSLHQTTLSSPNGNTHPLNYINPNDIESIEVLKDADATAIYGSRGANGVVLITTKKGKAGKTSVDVNVYTGAGKAGRKMDLLSTPQYLQMRREAFANDGVAPGTSDYDINGAWDTTRYTDWQKVLIGGTAAMTSAQLSVYGGNENTQFKVGGGYLGESTVFPGDYIDHKLSMHLMLTHRSRDQKFFSTFSVNFLSNQNNLIASDPTRDALLLAPVAPRLYNDNGELNWQNSTWTNPFAILRRTYKVNAKNLNLNGILGYKILTNLELKTSVGYNSLSNNETVLLPRSSGNPSSNPNNISIFGNTSVESWIVEPQIVFSKKIGPGKLGIQAGATFQQSKSNGLALAGIGYASDALLENIRAANSIFLNAATNSTYRYNAFFGRINYDLDGRYIINLTARRDGSSRFGPGRQFANFGAVGAAWIFSRESFIEKALPFLSFGKLRASYGTAGNDQIGDYGFLDTYSPGINYQGVIGIGPTRIFNADFGWELTRKLEVGLELGLLNDRIQLASSYYFNRSSNQLVDYFLPPTTGFSGITDNFPATVQNSGWELEISTVNLRSKRFQWATSINATFPKNKLVEYPGIATSPYATSYKVGSPLTIRRTGIYRGLDPATGVYQFEDIDGNGSITSADRTLTRSEIQSFYGGIQNSFTLGDWQLDVFFQFVKQNGRDYPAIFSTPPGTLSNQPVWVMERWQRSGDQASVEKFTQRSSSDAYAAFSNYRSSDYIYVDASFARLKNISLSYNFPPAWARKVKLQRARAYVQAQNVLTITSYKGLDPEVPGTPFVPPLRVITAGLNITL